MKKMCDDTKALVKDAAGRLTGYRRRAYQAQITSDYFGGSPRRAEREMGWGRESVEKGLGESETGIRCLDNYQGRGRKRSEDRIPGPEEDIRAIAEPQTRADPAVKSSATYTGITAKAVRQTLADEKGYSGDKLPSGNTVGNMLNRMGYNLKRVLKAGPEKKLNRLTKFLKMYGRQTANPMMPPGP